MTTAANNIHQPTDTQRASARKIIDASEIALAPYQTVWLSNRRPETSVITTAGNASTSEDG